MYRFYYSFIFLLSVNLFAQDFARVDYIILQGIEQKFYPGAQLLIGNEKEIIYYKNYGRFTYDNDSPEVSDSSLFDLASLTKVIATTSAIMKLYDEGKISLNDFVSEYIPEFHSFGKDSIRIINLLLHNSGLKRWFPFYTNSKSKKDVVRFICEMELDYEPGTNYTYSDLNMIILSEIVEKVSGKPFDKFCEEEIFSPLGMSNTFFNPPDTKKKNCLPTEDDKYWRFKLIQGEVHDENASLMNGVAGHAGLFSNAKDLFLFMRMMLNRGVYEDLRRETVYPVYINLFKSETVDLFTSKYKTNRYENFRALGWMTKPVQQPEVRTQCGFLISENSFGHFGFTGTSVWCDKERKLIIIFLTNRIYPTRENDGITKIRPELNDEIIKTLFNN
ncbi:MAG: serine hydrolase [Ignavibacteria bacterium]|nr:serine hydrolase [Ignavibacteria bacterium]